MAGPSTTIATAVVIARPVSKEPVEVISVYTRKRCRFSGQGVAGHERQPVWPGTAMPSTNGRTRG